MTSKKRELESRQWAKCQQVGMLPPEEVFKHQFKRSQNEDFYEAVKKLYDLMPKQIQEEIDAEKFECMVFKPYYSIFEDKWYKKLVGLNIDAYYKKIIEKMEKAGFSWK